MKKNLIYALTFVAVATMLFLKANSAPQKDMNDTVLDNVEALAQNEIIEHGYVCYGTGNVICPSSGERVAGYQKRRNLE